MRTVLILVLSALLIGLQPFATASAASASRQLSERTYKQLSKIHTLMDKGAYQKAIAELDRLRPRVERKPYEHALLLQTYGHVYARLEQYPQAIDVLQQCLKLDALPVAASKQSLYLLVQMQLVAADYQAAATSLERWFELEQDPAPSAHALAGTVYAYTKNYPLAIKHLGKAIKQARNPDENWYRQLLAVYYESRQYEAAAQLLQQLISRSPGDKHYWLQLSSIYHELGNNSQSIAVMELAYLRDLLTQETELINLARYYLHMELPYKAGQLLEKALNEGSISPSIENWRLLSDVWLHAREPDLALAATERALKFTRDANLHLQRAQLLADSEQWSSVLREAETAITTAGLDSPGNAHLLKGIAHYKLQQLQRAQASFEHAGDFEDTRKQAERWLQHVESARNNVASAPETAHLRHAYE
jgi:tetratricopeptide (TPR) repeat protein